MRTRFLALVALGFATAGLANAADFYLHNTLDLSNTSFFGAPLFDNNSPLGTNPSAITTDGQSLWIGGFNGGTSVASVAGITKISNPWSASPSATQLTSLSTPGSRGYSGLAYDPVNGVVFAAYDDGAADPNGITGWSASTNANLWAKNARGGSGVAYDTGFGGVDKGAAWTTFGSGRRALQNSTTGVDIYTTSDGMIINAGSGSFWRDMYFAPDGDVWARRSNGVIKTDRTGGNSGVVSTIVAPVASADFVNGHNIAYLAGVTGGDLVIYNDRPSTALGQLFATAIKVLNADGSVATTQFFDGNGGALPAGFGLGSGYFDFAWDQASGSLLVLDLANRSVYRFRTAPIPEPSTLALLGLGAAAFLRRRR